MTLCSEMLNQFQNLILRESVLLWVLMVLALSSYFLMMSFIRVKWVKIKRLKYSKVGEGTKNVRMVQEMLKGYENFVFSFLIPSHFMHPLHILHTLLTFFVLFNFFENFNYMFFFHFTRQQYCVKRLNTLEIETKKLKY